MPVCCCPALGDLFPSVNTDLSSQMSGGRNKRAGPGGDTSSRLVKSQLPHSGIQGGNQLAGPAQLLNPRSHPQTRRGPLGVALRAGLRAASLCPNALQASKQASERERERKRDREIERPTKHPRRGVCGNSAFLGARGKEGEREREQFNIVQTCLACPGCLHCFSEVLALHIAWLLGCLGNGS